MPVCLVRLYVDEELKRTDALQVQEGNEETFFNLFKRQESSTSLVLSKALAVGPDGTGGKMKMEVQPGVPASSILFSSQHFPNGGASLEFYAMSSSLSKHDKVVPSPMPPKSGANDDEDGEEGELLESSDPRKANYNRSSETGGGSGGGYASSQGGEP